MLVRIYTSQNATLLEITCHDSVFSPMYQFTVLISQKIICLDGHWTSLDSCRNQKSRLSLDTLRRVHSDAQ